MSTFEIIKLQEEYAVKRDAKEFSLGDTLDVKTSIILAVIVFLATQSAGFFQSTLSKWACYLQYASVAALILAGIFAVLELRPREYEQEDTPTRYDEWIEKLRIFYADSENAESQVLEQAIIGRTQRARERAEANILVNKRKSDLLTLAFWLTVASLGLNLATLAIHPF